MDEILNERSPVGDARLLEDVGTNHRERGPQAHEMGSLPCPLVPAVAALQPRSQPATIPAGTLGRDR